MRFMAHTGKGSQASEMDNTIPVNISGSQIGNLTADAVRKMSEKLSEMMGEDVGKTFESLRNDRGELINEEGLPIIDIAEPLAAVETGELQDAALILDDTPSLITDLTPSVRERWRQERDYVLDRLEEEERKEQAHAEQKDFEERQALLRKRKEETTKEDRRLKAAKEMQRKMGKALLRNTDKAREQEDQAEAVQLGQDDKKHTTGSKKTVAFADLPDANDQKIRDSEQVLDWGDVTPARLRSTGPSLLSSANRPMKDTVVERMPTDSPKTHKVIDSDDESAPSSFETSEDEGFDAADRIRNKPADSDVEENLEFEEEEFDLDLSQHRREIALRYYEKRNKFGEVALGTMSSHARVNDGGVPADVPLDMPVSDPDRPLISQFKANHFVSSYDASTSTFSGASVVPASTARTLQKAIRIGKLDAEERLVSGGYNSDSEHENEDVQEVLDLLKKGELYNVGPDENRVYAISENKPEVTGEATPSSTATAPTSPFTDLPPMDKPKASRFKVSRSKAGRPSATQPPLIPFGPNLRSGTPLPVVEGSSMKLPNTATSDVLERMAAASPPVAFPSNVVDSISLPPSNPIANQPTALPSPFTMIVDSPSFAKPTTSQANQPSNTRLKRPPTVMSSTVLESSYSPPVDLNSKATRPKSQRVSRFKSERLQ